MKKLFLLVVVFLSCAWQVKAVADEIVVVDSLVNAKELMQVLELEEKINKIIEAYALNVKNYSKKYSLMTKDLDPDEKKIIDQKIDQIKQDFGVTIHLGYIPLNLSRSKKESERNFAKRIQQDFTKYEQDDFSISGEDTIEVLPAV